MAIKATMGRRLGMTALAWAVGLALFFPILWTFLTSFKSELDAFAVPPKFIFFHWTLENYFEVQSRSNYLLFAYNSIVLSVGANIAALVIAVPAAWSIPTIATACPLSSSSHDTTKPIPASTNRAAISEVAAKNRT